MDEIKNHENSLNDHKEHITELNKKMEEKEAIIDSKAIEVKELANFNSELLRNGKVQEQ